MTGTKRAAKDRGEVTFETVRLAAAPLPGVEESTSYGTPALNVRGKLFARLHQSGECFVLRTRMQDRAALMRSDPSIFYITDHYQDYPWILVRFLTADPNQLPAMLERAWRLVAPKSLIASAGKDLSPSRSHRKQTVKK
jgi:hypothetical protein